MSGEKFHRIRIDEAPTVPLPMGRGTVFKLVDPDIGAVNADIHVNVIEPGAGRGEIHFHEKAENTYIVLEGQLEVCIEGGVRSRRGGGRPYSARRGAYGDQCAPGRPLQDR